MSYRIGLVWHGDYEARQTATLESSRFAGLGTEMERAGFAVTPIIYNDEWSEECLSQLKQLDAVQVWVNPIVAGKDRTVLDSILREVAAGGTLVFTHPNTIMRLGTKRVLVELRETSLGSELYEHADLDSLRNGLLARLPSGARVLKQYRGHSGGGIWRIAAADESGDVLLRHAERGCPEEHVTFEEAIERMRMYFDAGNPMIEQPNQDLIGEGMIRVYLVGQEVAGFGHQEAVALAPANADGSFPDMGPRLYFPPEEPKFRHIREQMENVWLAELVEALQIRTDDLPLLWDIDLMFGPKDESGQDTFVLCEINVSCVSPYPEWANEPMARTLLEKLEAHNANKR